jgi:hypothetical protein
MREYGQPRVRFGWPAGRRQLKKNLIKQHIMGCAL